MITAVALVCLYTEPDTCQAHLSKVFYPTLISCQLGRLEAEDVFNTVNQGVVSYTCVDWGVNT